MALTKDQKSALDLVLLGHSVSVGAQAGVGKSFLVERIYHQLSDRGKRVSLTCTTGIACCRFSKIDGTVKSTSAQSPGEGICKAADEIEANLIVVGTRGLGTVRRTFMGSVSDFVLHHANVPVLVCRMDK